MAEIRTFSEAKKAYMKTLKQYVPVVDRVHGQHHPEFHEVKALYDSIALKIREAGRRRPQLEDEFIRLRAVTDNYAVPDDVCESYEAVYQMLAALDRSYHA